jgi:hypothetical protein
VAKQLSGRPVHLATAEDVDVQMVDRLAAVGAHRAINPPAQPAQFAACRANTRESADNAAGVSRAFDTRLVVGAKDRSKDVQAADCARTSLGLRGAMR